MWGICKNKTAKFHWTIGNILLKTTLAVGGPAAIGLRNNFLAGSSSNRVITVPTMTEQIMCIGTAQTGKVL
jgi:hypothetical protein